MSMTLSSLSVPFLVFVPTFPSFKVPRWPINAGLRVGDLQLHPHSPPPTRF